MTLLKVRMGLEFLLFLVLDSECSHRDATDHLVCHFTESPF